MALGYDLARFVNADPTLDAYLEQGLQLPDFILVRKCFDEARAKRAKRRAGRRGWTVKRLDMEVDDSNFHARKNQAFDDNRQAEHERFLQARCRAAPSQSVPAGIRVWEPGAHG